MVLAQNTGRQAAILRKLSEARARFSGSFGVLRRKGAEWQELLRDTEAVVREMPLWKLQTLGKAKLDFLYENLGKGTNIELRPGVAFCFRRFYWLVVDMVRGAWVRYVRRQNREALGTATDLADFMFGMERASLLKVQAVLEDVQRGTCFYCGARCRAEESQVDHFIPWSRYPLDLGHNFVLAHTGCNADKGDYLAATEHLHAWTDRNTAQRRLLDDAFEKEAILHDLGTSARIAHWSYSQLARTGGQAWLRKKDLRALQASWEDPFLPLLKVRPMLGM
jgi:5-methylcytosine-specific restriction endonuclease McrA